MHVQRGLDLKYDPRQVCRNALLPNFGPLIARVFRGTGHYLYLIVDIFSRKIVGWEIHERESAD